MLRTLAISGYRSIRQMVMPLGELTVVTGPNGSGKSSVYRALRLLAAAAEGDLVQSLAREGGLQSTLWAGPEIVSREMQLGEVPLQGSARKKPVRLQLGFATNDAAYTIDLGLPVPGGSPFMFDPIVKRECLWHGSSMKPSQLLADRRGPLLRVRGASNSWENVDIGLSEYSSFLTEYSDPVDAPHLVMLRDTIRSWRFYDHFRSDVDAPARRAHVATYTPVMSDDGSDLAAALKTILAIGDGPLLQNAIHDAFPGSEVVFFYDEPYLDVGLKQPGMLRPLRSAELSDGTLRFLLLAAAILTPRPPQLTVLNEPETSLHPDALPALGRLLAKAAIERQFFVVTHAQQLVDTLTEQNNCLHYELEKSFGATQLVGLEPFDLPTWKWPAR